MDGWKIIYIYNFLLGFGLFSGAMLVSGSVDFGKTSKIFKIVLFFFAIKWLLIALNLVKTRKKWGDSDLKIKSSQSFFGFFGGGE